ncbi:MAG: protein phosphatase CheZ [Alphaproteobacteria bacterium]|nr:protein phosphatase CheZ [Alphaproteobacteria bacterium]
MSLNREPNALDLGEFPEDLALDEELAGDDDPVENQRELSNREYDALEEAVMQTARGRTFLREHAQRNRAVASDLVLRAMDDCQAYFKRQDLKQPSEILTAELQNMSDAISHTRRDIAAIKPKEGANNRIMAATEDLDAIVTSTERATNDILAAAERIQDSCMALREKDADSELCDAMEEDITNIFLACSFQDLTGQRTTKVVNALHYLEQRVGAMIQIWGSESLRNAAVDEFSPDLEDDHAEAGLLNGPQNEGHGVAQHDIDHMLLETVDPADEGNQAADEAVNGADPTEGIEFDVAASLSTESLPEDRLMDDDVADPTEGIEFDVAATLSTESLPEDRLMDDDVADPTEGIEFDTPADASSEPVIEAQALEDDGAPAAATDADQDATEFSGAGEEMDNDSIDAMFDS